MPPYNVGPSCPQAYRMEHAARNEAVFAGSRVCLHLIASLDPKWGGPQEGLKQLTAAALRVGQRLEVASLDPPDSPWRADYPCPVHLLGPGRLGKYGYAPAMLPWLQDNSGRISVIVVHGLWQYHGMAAWRLWRRTGTPYFVYTHGMLDPWFKRTYPLKHLKKSLYWPWAEYRVLRDAQRVLFTCEAERTLARQSFARYRANESVVGFGIPRPPGNPQAQRAAFLARFPELHGQRLLLFLGRIHPKKGCDLLVEAFARAAARDPRLQLVLAGPDQQGTSRALAERIERLGVAQRVTWTGMLSGDLKWGAFHAAEAFALPSHQENFGIAVVEALACGLPVLISTRINIWQEIVAGGAGIAAADTLAGTHTLLDQWFALSAVERRAMAQRAAECFRRHFMIDAAALNLDAVIAGARCAPAWLH